MPIRRQQCRDPKRVLLTPTLLTASLLLLGRLNVEHGSQRDDGDKADRKPRRNLADRAKRIGRKGRDAAREAIETSGEFLGKAGETTSGVTRKTVEQVGELAQGSWDLASTGFESVSERTQGAAAAALELGQTSKDALKGRIFREARVPVLLLPTGSGHSDFFVRYSFGSTLDTLRSGTFVRPVLEVWAARPDVDRSRLVDVLNETFLRDFKEQKEIARSRHGLANMETVVAAREAKAEREEKGKELQGAASWVGVGLVGMFLTWNPLFDLIFLTLAVYKGASGIRKALAYVGHSFRETEAEVELDKSKKALSRLQADLDSKNEVFRQAASNLEVNVHPQLQELLVDFAAIDGRLYVPVSATSDGPDIRDALALVDYRRQLPDWGLTILEGHQATMSSGQITHVD